MSDIELNGVVLGRLATKDEVAEFRSKGGENAEGSEVVHNGRAYIKPLSKLPYNQRFLERNDLFVCYTSNHEILANKENGENRYVASDYSVEQKLRGKYVTFTPQYNSETSNYHKSICGGDFRILDKNKVHADERKVYVPVPIVEIREYSLNDFDILDRYLEMGYCPEKSIVLSEAYEDMPYILIAFSTQPSNSSKTFVYEISGIKVDSKRPIINIDSSKENRAEVVLEEIIEQGIYDKDNGIIFLPEEKVLSLYNEINRQNGKEEVEQLERYRTINNNQEPFNTPFSNLDKIIDRETLRRDSVKIPTFEKEKDTTKNESIKNLTLKAPQILNEFKKIAFNNFLYNEKDIINFDLCVRTSKFIILSGISGTGKSQLVRTYADALCAVEGISERDNRLIIPVSPSWTDDADVLGYFDYEKNKYQPADTGLVDFLIKASKNPERQYIVCFDEMNLAKIEHYFSKFISLLELPVDERVLCLYSKNNLSDNKNYPPMIKILDNVCFVGTVNIDESTTPISDKMLDRANKIELDIRPFTLMKDMLDNKLTDDELELLTELHNVIHEQEPKLGIGYRIICQMAEYLNNVDIYGKNFSRGEGIDYVVAQRIISKLRGSVEEVGNLVNNEITGIFEKYDNLSTFTKARELLKRKAKELETYGYTI